MHSIIMRYRLSGPGESWINKIEKEKERGIQNDRREKQRLDRWG